MSTQFTEAVVKKIPSVCDALLPKLISEELQVKGDGSVR